MKQFRIFLLASTVILFTACGGGSSPDDTTSVPPDDTTVIIPGDNQTVTPDNPQPTTIDKIKAYADDNTQPVPTVEDYTGAGVVGVTQSNLDKVNNVVTNLTSSDVDTTEKIQNIVDGLDINSLPTANAGPDKYVGLSEVVSIKGSGTGTDGMIVSYEWTKDAVVVATTASFNYIPTAVGTDTLTLTVMDDDGETASDSMNVIVTEVPPVNQVPIADAGINQEVLVSSTVTLDGSGSSDVHGDLLTYDWSFVSKPSGSTAILSDTTVVNPTFTADVDGSYVVQLIVNDGTVDSAPSTVTISAKEKSSVFYVSNTVEFRQALLDAAQNGMDDTIILAAGIYKTTDDGEGTFMFLDGESYELFIVGSSKENVILDGSNQDQIFNHISTNWSSRITLDNLTFKNGKSSKGGAVYIDKKGTILNCIFTDNNATSAGGGFYSDDRVIVRNSLFLNNYAGQVGGGFYSLGTAIIEDCNFTSNVGGSPGTGGGGGFATGRNDTIFVTNSRFENNSAGVNGGGFSSYWTAIVKNSFFKNNSANGTGIVGYGYGGGFSSSNGSAEIENSIFIQNNATVGGGAFSVKRYQLKIVNSLFINNANGIYIEEDNTHTIVNSIFKNNGIEIDGGSEVIVNLKNNYIDKSKVNVPSLSDENIFNAINLGFVNEANNDFHLSSTSDLIDAGVNSYSGVTIPTTDINGNPRPVGASTDIGPYEYQ